MPEDRSERRAFADLFKHLCVDVVSAVLATDSEQRAVDALCSRLSRWQKFLEDAAGGLSETRQTGLYGELYFLRRLLLAGCTPRRALDGWKGPLGTNQDFMFGRSAVEIKSTTANTDTVLVIANERQLDDAGISSLTLLGPGTGLQTEHPLQRQCFRGQATARI